MLDAMSIELDAFVDEHLALEKLHRQTGRLLVAEALQAVQPATIVRTRNGKVSTTDGPFAAANMQPGGVFRTRHW